MPLQPSNDDEETQIMCFVYGAMSNPISRSRRNIETLSAIPAVLPDYQITFGQGGAANVQQKRGWTVHGVILQCKTRRDLQLLKEIGANYESVEIKVYPYENNDSGVDTGSVLAHVYVMDQQGRQVTDELPQERYIRIIAEGLQYHGVEEEYIDYSIMNANYEPYPEVWLTFEPRRRQGNNNTKELAYSTYLSKSTRHLWFLVGRKVIEIQGIQDRRDEAFVKWACNELVGKPDVTFYMLEYMYDPSLAVCETPDDVQQDHVQWAEHQLVEKFRESNVTALVAGIVEDASPKKRRSLLRNLSRRAFSLGSLKIS